MRWVLLHAVVLLGCPKPAPAPSAESVVKRAERHMSTVVTITVAATDSPAVQGAISQAFARLSEVEGLLSEWRPGSEMTAVNEAAGGPPVKVSAQLLAVVERALDISRRSQGAFDATVGSLWGAWDFSFERPRVPTDAELAPRLALIDHASVRADPKAGTLTLAKPGMRLTVGGIAKGYAVDQASATLTAAGYPNHLVVAGGDLYASGDKHGAAWVIGVRDPRGEGVWGTLEVKDEALATSGHYERFFFKDGVRHHHILDPRTGRPAAGVAQTTVRAPDCVTADGWSTAFFVMGADRALAQAERLPGVELLLFGDPVGPPRQTPWFGRLRPRAAMK